MHFFLIEFYFFVRKSGARVKVIPFSHNRTEETLIEENSAILCSLLKQRLKSILKAFIRFFCRLGRNKKIIFILLFSASVVEIFIDGLFSPYKVRWCEKCVDLFLIFLAQGDLTYFYTRDKLQWTMSEFTGWNFYDAAIKLAVSAAAIRRFNLYESSLGETSHYTELSCKNTHLNQEFAGPFPESFHSSSSPSFKHHGKCISVKEIQCPPLIPESSGPAIFSVISGNSL